MMLLERGSRMELTVGLCSRVDLRFLSLPPAVGQLLSFDIGEQPVFEIPLSNVSQCTTGKNEVTLEFHQNDDAEVSLMEVRFYVPPTQEDGVDPVEVSEAQ